MSARPIKATLLITHHLSLITYHSSLVNQCLHASKRTSRFFEGWLLFDRQTVMPRGVQILAAHFVNATEIKVRKRVRLIAWRHERPFEPADATVSIALG